MKVDDLPFMQQIRDAFVSTQTNQFLLTGNVLDVYPRPETDLRRDRDSAPAYVGLAMYLRERLGRQERLLITYNLARGIEFRSDEERQQALAIYLTLFSLPDRQAGLDSFNEVMARTSSYILPSLILLRKLCKAAAQSSATPVAIIVEYAEAVVPDNAITQMNDQDRQRLVFFKEWLTEPNFVDSNHLLILISETTSAFNSSLRSLPHLLNVHLPLPDESQRRAYLRWCREQNPELKLSGSQRSFARLSAGMTLLGIEQIIRLAQYQKGRLDPGDFTAHLNRLLISRIGEQIEVVEPGHSFKDVVGNAALKSQLQRLTRTLQSGKPELAPVGMLVTGPNGVGKTYILMAWAKETGRTVIMLKNLRSQYFGETDQIFEKVRNVLEVLGHVIVIVDEADTVFARPGSGTHETEARLFGNVIKMMGDPKNRSKIVWVLMTARPDNLAPDLKRSGRCGLHLPIFDPEGQDREDFIDMVLGQLGLRLDDFQPEARQRFLDYTATLSPADFHELAGELKTEVFVGKADPTPELVFQVLAEYLPGDVSVQRRLQTLHAVLHCSRRSLLPPSLCQLSREAVHREIALLQGAQ